MLMETVSLPSKISFCTPLQRLYLEGNLKQSCFWVTKNCKYSTAVRSRISPKVIFASCVRYSDRACHGVCVCVLFFARRNPSLLRELFIVLGSSHRAGFEVFSLQGCNILAGIQIDMFAENRLAKTGTLRALTQGLRALE